MLNKGKGLMTFQTEGLSSNVRQIILFLPNKHLKANRQNLHENDSFLWSDK